MSNDKSEDGLGRRVGGALGGAIDGAVGFAVGSVGGLTHLIGAAFRLPRLLVSKDRGQRQTMLPGTAAGIEHAPDVHVEPDPGEVKLVCCDYGADQSGSIELPDVRALIAHPRPEWSRVRWLRVEGLHPYVVNALREEFGFHTLAAEDVVHVPQRPRAEPYPDHLFVVAQLLTRENEGLVSQQVSFFLRHDLLVSFQERPTHAWQPLLARLARQGSPIRSGDASFLAYTLLDTIVDHGFPILDAYAEYLERLEEEIMSVRGSELLSQIHGIKRELAVLRRVLWPTRELVTELAHKEQHAIGAAVRAYLSDVRDHCTQLIDMLDTFRDVASSLTDLHLSMATQRTNESMQVLTVMATIFIPITFLAGVYGMNFRVLPELQWRYGYAVFWGLCVTLTSSLLWYFRRRGWLGRS